MKEEAFERTGIYLADEISKQIGNENMVGALYIDLSKAFDTLSHTVLLSKIKSYSIKGLTLKWFEYYLFNRVKMR